MRAGDESARIFYRVHIADRIASVTTSRSKGGFMRNFVTGLAAAALLASIATPADARQRRHHRHHDDVDAGDVIAGAVVAAGIASIASAMRQARREKQDAAVDRCSAEAEGRTGGRVSEILHVARRKGYYTVEGAFEGGGDVPRDTFTCTVRRGAIYSFQATAGEA
jgi:hypothetical protein